MRRHSFLRAVSAAVFAFAFVFAVVASAVALMPGEAHAQDDAEYRLLDFKMLSSPADPFRYYVHDAAMNLPSTVLPAQVQQHVEAAYATWQNVACAYPAFQSQGLTSNNLQIADPRDTQDKFNVTAIWVTSSNDPYYGFALGGGTAAAATVPTAYAGTLYQCDIYLNAVDFQISTQTPTPAGHLDLQSLILHEVGHCLGIGHSEEWTDVMYPSNTIAQQRRALTTRDVGIVCGKYPQTGAVGSPCMNDPDCGAASLKCVRPPLPDGGMGAPFCSKGCEPNVPGGCDAPYVCKPSTLIAGSNGTCLPTTGDFVTQVGAPCTAHNQCGSSVGLCFEQGQLPSGAPAWKDGYCTQSCGAQNIACPAGSECVTLGGSELCLKSCRLGTGDCRFGYTCVRATESLNLCVSACAQDQDCGDTTQFQCRTCDGACLPKQNTAATIGDLCNQSSQCGPEQFCLTFEGAGDVGVCSKNCGTACSECAGGSSCHPLADGNLYCLRDCVQGSCPQGFQCGLLGTGRACIPGCMSSSECPVGTTCSQGQCTTGGQDGGTCALCPTDSGVTGPPPPKPDAGSGPGASGGCGCGAAATGGAMIGWLVPLALLSLRPRAPRRRSAARADRARLPE